MGVITCMDKPTNWVTSITCVLKANGELCLCLDPSDLKETICHDHHKTPTVEEVAHEFAHSCYFRKLDACHGYWSVILDQESSLLTTFNSPFRRSFPVSSLWPCLFARYLPEEDGPNLRRLPRLHWDHR